MLKIEERMVAAIADQKRFICGNTKVIPLFNYELFGNDASCYFPLDVAFMRVYVYGERVAEVNLKNKGICIYPDVPRRCNTYVIQSRIAAILEAFRHGFTIHRIPGLEGWV